MSLATPSRVLCIALLLGACTDVRTGQVASQEERTAAAELVAQLSALSTHPVDGETILQASSAASLVTLLAPPGTPEPTAQTSSQLVIETAAESSSESTAESTIDRCLIATATSVTYSECQLAEHVVDGTWSMQRRRVHARLVDVFVTEPGLHGSIAIDANLRAGTEVSGTLDMGLMWTASGAEYTLDANMRVDGLVIDGSRCATSGSITLTGTLTGSLGDGSSSTTTLWFGPSCQDVQISR
jgi:hypothetical protein